MNHVNKSTELATRVGMTRRVALHGAYGGMPADAGVVHPTLLIMLGLVPFSAH